MLVYHVRTMKAIIFWTILIVVGFVLHIDRMDWLSWMSGFSVAAIGCAWALRTSMGGVVNEGRRRMAARRES